MLNSLNIKNFRILKALKINSLGRVNLITGKNNTGKSTILEAIAIYAYKGDYDFVYQLLKERGEISDRINTNTNITDANMRTFSSLFYNRNIDFDDEDVISIGESDEDCISLKFVKYVEELQRDEDWDLVRKRRLLKNNSETIDNYKIGLKVELKDKSNVLPLDEDRPFRLSSARRFKGTIYNTQFVRTKDINSNINGSLFDNIALTDKEQYAIEALKIIEPLTERIAFIDEERGKRNPVIKLSGSQQVLPLQSMGDGINRIFTIILALVNADNGFLLLDEFENGLHHTVQEKLWEIIFSLSKKLNIQVFATTHSKDCIRGFGNVLNNSDNLSDGKLIRLDNKKGTIKEVEFDAEELKFTNNRGIEIR